jgi:general secretion pathway protein D
MITQLIPLSYADAGEIKQLFTPLVSKNSVILSYEATNTLIVTDVQSNIDRLLKILKAIDAPGIGQEISIIPLHYADSEKLVKTLDTVFKPQRVMRVGHTPTPTAKFVADPRTNSIITVASKNDLTRIKRLVEILDKEAPRGKGKIHVYYLENATAEDVAKVLTQLPPKNGATNKAKETPIVSGDVRITADKATNSLIIMADPEDYQVLEDVIQKLDIPRSMVYIEALIMEVDLTKSFNLGIKWSIFGATKVHGKSAGIGGGFGDGGFSIGSSDLTNSGLSLGVITSDAIQMTVGGTVLSLPNLGAVANAFKSDKDVNILSTPQVLTTDNEEATIVVASTIPYKTQTSSSSAVTGEIFNSYEYRDVGFTLKITPHISKDRLVRLKISQEYTALTTSPDQVSDTPSTLKRSVDTTVIVQDRHTVVIGGLIDNKLSNTVNQVPCLGDVPFLGKLFSTNGKGNEKTDLYIFITPRVIKNPEEAEAIMKEKSQGVDRSGDEQIKLYNPAHPNVIEPSLNGKPAAPEGVKKSP